MGLSDLLWGDSIPTTTSELTKYLIDNNTDLSKKLKENPKYHSALETAVRDSIEYYKPFLGGMKTVLHKAGKAVGYASEAAGLASGGMGIVATLGGEYIDLLAQIPDKVYGLWYGLRTGDVLGAAENVLRGALSYIPGLTVADKGIDQIIRERMRSYAVKLFERSIGTYKPWHQRAYESVKNGAVYLADGVKEAYKGVKSRVENIFTPDTEPVMA